MRKETIKEVIEESTGSEPTESYDQDKKSVDWKTAEKMKKESIVDSLECIYFNLKYTIFGGKSVARIEYAVFDEVGYVRWIRVNDGYQNCGIGGKIWDYAISDMRKHGANLVYTKAVASGTKIIAENDGFKKPIELPNPWLVNEYEN